MQRGALAYGKRSVGRELACFFRAASLLFDPTSFGLFREPARLFFASSPVFLGTSPVFFCASPFLRTITLA